MAFASGNPAIGALATNKLPADTFAVGVRTSANDIPPPNDLINVPSTTPQPLDLDFGEEIVSIFVGKKRKKYVVHKKRMCKSCQYLKNAFGGFFEEAGNRELYWEEDKPEVVELLINYLYSSKIAAYHTETHLQNLYELYFLAERINVIEVMDKTMDAIQEMAMKYDLMDELIAPNVVQQAIKTPQKNRGLRLFCIDMMIYVFLRRSQELPGNLDVQSSKANNEKDFKDDPQIFINRNDLKLVLELSQEDFPFFSDFIFRLCGKFQDYGARLEFPEIQSLIDPRRRQERPESKCFYHIHKTFYGFRACTGVEEQIGNPFVRHRQLA